MEGEPGFAIAVGEDVATALVRDEQSFARLIDAHHAEMVRVAYAVCGDLELARDATQIAWIKAWRALPRLRDTARVRSWLVAIAANEARQAARSHRRRQIREIRPVLPVSDAAADERLDLIAAFERLPAADRELLALRYVAGLAAGEIADARGLSASGVRTRLSRVLRVLREEMAHE